MQVLEIRGSGGNRDGNHLLRRLESPLQELQGVDPWLDCILSTLYEKLKASVVFVINGVGFAVALHLPALVIQVSLLAYLFR